MTHTVLIPGLTQGHYASERATNAILPSENWETLKFDPIDDPVLIERLGGRPLVVRTSGSTGATKLLSVRSARVPEVSPYDAGVQLVRTINELGHDVDVLRAQPTKGGLRQAFTIPTITRPDPIEWDRGLFSSMLGPKEDDGLNLVIALFFRKLKVQLMAGWLRPFCSNQLVDRELGLAPALRRIPSLDEITPWATSAVGAATVMATRKSKAIVPPQELPFFKPTVRWTANNFAAGADSDPRVLSLREDIEDRVGVTAGDLLAQQLFAMTEVDARPIDIVNAVTNLSRPRGSLITDRPLPGDPERPIVSPLVIGRHQDAIVDDLLQALFLGNREMSGSDHEVLEAHPFRGDRR